MKKLLTADEVAELLQVDRSTVYRWAKAGMPHYRVGRVVRFSEDLAQWWIGGHLVGNTDPVGRQKPATSSRVDRLRAAVSEKVQAAGVAAQE